MNTPKLLKMKRLERLELLAFIAKLLKAHNYGTEGRPPGKKRKHWESFLRERMS